MSKKGEKECSGVRFGGFGEGGGVSVSVCVCECGRNASPGQILCPREPWLSAFFFFRSLWTEHVPERENVWSRINLRVEDCGFITLG